MPYTVPNIYARNVGGQYRTWPANPSNLQAAAGSYTTNGQGAILVPAKRLISSSGGFSLAGQNTTLSYSGGSADPYADSRTGYLAGDLVFDSVNGNNANAGTLASPKQQILAANITTALAQNRRIWLRGHQGQQYVPFVDTYNGLMNKNGTAMNPMVVATYPGDTKAIWTSVANTTQNQWEFQSSYWEFRNIDIRSFGDNKSGVRGRNGFFVGENVQARFLSWIDCNIDISLIAAGQYDNSGGIFLNNGNADFIKIIRPICTGSLVGGAIPAGCAPIISFRTTNLEIIGPSCTGAIGAIYIKHGFPETNPALCNVLIKNMYQYTPDLPFNTNSSYARYENCLIVDGSDTSSNNGLWLGDDSGLSGGNDSIVNHCTFVGSGIFLDAKGAQRKPTNVQILNSVIQDHGARANRRIFAGESSAPGTLGTITDYNLFGTDMEINGVSQSLATRRAGGNDVHSIKGVATFVGSNPATPTDWALATGSLGKLLGNDGKDLGCDVSKLLTVN